MENDVDGSLNDKLKNRILFFLGILIFTFPILPNALQSISILSLTGLSFLFYFTKKTAAFTTRHVVGFAITTFWALYLCITVLYSDDVSYGIKMAQRYINCIVLPFTFVFFAPKLFLQKKHYFYLSFILSNLLFVLIIYYRAILAVETSCFPEIYYKNVFDKLGFILKKPNHVIFSCFENEVRHSFFIHRVYNSMNFLFCILLLIELWFSKKYNQNLLFYLLSVICTIIFGYLIFYQFSVVNVILAIVLIPVFLFIKIPSGKIRIVLAILLVILLASVSVMYINTGPNKVADTYITPAFNLVKKVATGKNYSNIDERFITNKTSLTLIGKHPIFGYGIGDAQQVMKDYYDKHRSDDDAYNIAYEKNLNSHNNYAFFLLSGGIVLLVLYIINMIYSLYYGFVFKDWIYIAFLIIIGANLLFENILSRIHGVLFYALFNAIFIADLIRKKRVTV